jgi:hypothetical protein
MKLQHYSVGETTVLDPRQIVHQQQVKLKFTTRWTTRWYVLCTVRHQCTTSVYALLQCGSYQYPRSGRFHLSLSISLSLYLSISLSLYLSISLSLYLYCL